MVDITKKLIQKLKSDGYELNNELGSGIAGTAYDIGSGKVLKITDDIFEAKAMAMVMNSPHQNIVKVYRVWVYKSIPKTYMIEMEKLNKISDKVDYLMNGYGIVYDSI